MDFHSFIYELSGNRMSPRQKCTVTSRAYDDVDRTFDRAAVN